MSNSLLRAVLTPRGALAAIALVLTSAALANPATVNRAITEQAQTETAAKATQEKVNTLDDQTRSAVQEYRAVVQETDSLKRYNEQLALQLKAQEEEMREISQQLLDIETTSREVVPLLQKMLVTIEEFVKLDLPFLAEERSKRMEGLKEMMTRADVSIAEKYRRIVEAYQIEMEYGRTIEASQEKVGDKTVEVLRVGRVALLYQTLDGKESGYWDVNAKAWQEDNDYHEAVRSGLKVAKKQGAPDLLIIPVTAAKESK